MVLSIRESYYMGVPFGRPQMGFLGFVELGPRVGLIPLF